MCLQWLELAAMCAPAFVYSTITCMHPLVWPSLSLATEHQPANHPFPPHRSDSAPVTHPSLFPPADHAHAVKGMASTQRHAKGMEAPPHRTPLRSLEHVRKGLQDRVRSECLQRVQDQRQQLLWQLRQGGSPREHLLAVQVSTIPVTSPVCIHQCHFALLVPMLALTPSGFRYRSFGT